MTCLARTAILPPMDNYDSQFHCFGLQFIGNPRHPDERVNEEGRDAQKVRDPVSLSASSENIVQLVLQSVKRHIEEEENPCRAEINEAEPESGSVGVPEIHQS